MENWLVGRRTVLIKKDHRALILAVASAQNLQFSQNNVKYYSMEITTVILSKFDSICELQPEFRPRDKIDQG
jgi:hypothetical protein